MELMVGKFLPPTGPTGAQPGPCAHRSSPGRPFLTSGGEKGTDWQPWLMFHSEWDKVQSREKHKIITFSMKPWLPRQECWLHYKLVKALENISKIPTQSSVNCAQRWWWSAEVLPLIHFLSWHRKMVETFPKRKIWLIWPSSTSECWRVIQISSKVSWYPGV